MEVLKQRWLSYLVAVAIGFVAGLLIGKSSNNSSTITQPLTTNSKNIDSASLEKSGYILDSNMTR